MYNSREAERPVILSLLEDIRRGNIYKCLWDDALHAQSKQLCTAELGDMVRDTDLSYSYENGIICAAWEE